MFILCPLSTYELSAEIACHICKLNYPHDCVLMYGVDSITVGDNSLEKHIFSEPIRSCSQELGERNERKVNRSVLCHTPFATGATGAESSGSDWRTAASP